MMLESNETRQNGLNTKGGPSRLAPCYAPSQVTQHGAAARRILSSFLACSCPPVGRETPRLQYFRSA